MGNAVRSACGRMMADDLQIAHADALPGLELAPGDRLERGADRLGAVRALVDRKDEDCRGERLDQDADTRQAVKDDKKLHQHRRAADDPDVKPGDALQDGHMSNWTSATATAMMSASVKEMAVSGIVTVRPGSRILPKESRRMPTRRSDMGRFSPLYTGAVVFPTKTVCYEIVAHPPAFCKSRRGYGIFAGGVLYC